MQSRHLSEIISLFDQLLILFGCLLVITGLILFSFGIKQLKTRVRKGIVYLIIGTILIAPVIVYWIDYFFFINK